jgi:23S rRNA pseudouridine2605 synthase
MRSSAVSDARHRLRPIHAEVVEGSRLATSCTVQLCLREGVNREVRRVCEHFGWPLVTLSRASYGPWNLADLREGQVQEVPNTLLQQQLQDMHLHAAARGVT